jgi:hypothetical protein
MRHLTRDRITAGVLAVAYAGALIASWRHLAATFGAIEADADRWTGALAATAVDLGLAALALAIAHEARRGRRARGLWVAVIVLAIISALANADHVASERVGHLVTLPDLVAMDPLTLGRIVVYAATLPALVLLLAWCVERIALPEPATASLPAATPATAPEAKPARTAQPAPTRPRQAGKAAEVKRLMGQGMSRSAAYRALE